MSGQPLLHSSLNPRVTKALIALGVIVVLVGAADATTRLARLALGSNAGAAAFAPVAALPALYPTQASTTPLVPARLLIPAIGVNAKVEQVGKKANGEMGVPQSFGDVAWYAPGVVPGAPGNAVIAGHVNNALTTAGVFMHLAQVKAGDVVEVADASDRTLAFVVTSVQSYSADSETPAIADSIFASSGLAQLVLITCAGEWVPNEHQFNQRLVVTARLAQY